MIDINRFDKFKSKNGPRGANWVCVFGTSDAADEQSVAEAERIGELLAASGNVVVTGGYGAAMEGANRGAKKAGGFSVGVTCGIFSRPPNSYLDAAFETSSLIERIECLLRLGDGYLAGKGGTGTLAEIALAWEYVNKRIVPQRPVVLVGGYWQSLPDIIGDAKAAPGVSIGRAHETIFKSADATEAVEIVNREMVNLKG